MAESTPDLYEQLRQSLREGGPAQTAPVEHRRIVGVAYRFPESAGGTVWSAPAPARHCCPGGTTQGFVLSDGTFVDRFEALEIARSNGQLKRKTGPEDMLFSEDLW